jgi:hypothetical protein
MKNIVLFCFLMIFTNSLLSQNHDNRLCLTKCNAAEDEQKNIEIVRAYFLEATENKEVLFEEKLRFPIRIGIIEGDSTATQIADFRIQRTIDFLNRGFKEANIEFYIARIDLIESSLKLEDLTTGFYEKYNNFSAEYDLQDTISLFVFNNRDEFCTIHENTISCGRTGGFSYILSERTNNIVLSKFDLEDYKILAHEFGHFFGLYHTFEEGQFGKDDLSLDNCATLGDQICDTPPDPGTLFEVYVNYSTCEMMGLYDDNGKEYKPLIDNFMSYYKPCYLREYSFSRQQLEFMRAAAMSVIRRRFIH